MKEKTKNIWLKIKKIYGRKRAWALTVVVLIVLFAVLNPKSTETIVVGEATVEDVKQTILATGTVTSKTDLSMSFNGGGTVRSLRVVVGDQVKEGQILATLDQGSAYASLTSARGALLAAQARYDQLLAGASNEEVRVAEVALESARTYLKNTKTEQDTAVTNAGRALLNSGIAAVAEGGTSTSAPTISGSYTSDQEGVYTITTYNTGSGGYFSVSGLENATGQINTTSAKPLGTRGLYIQFPVNYQSSVGQTFKIKIPNTEASTYLTNYNLYQSALQTRDNTVSSAQADVNAKEAALALKKKVITTPEINLAKADILSAQGQVGSAEAVYENTLIRAAAAGIVTAVNIKLGELAEIGKPAIVIEDIGNLYVEAKINEANITSLVLGLPSEFTIDAFGPTQKFNGTIMAIDPGATIEEGIVNYKVKSSITQTDGGIKPGMNANMTIYIDTKSEVLVVPAASLVTHDGKTFARVITNEKRKKYEEREVTVGKTWDGNLIEVATGLVAGEKIALIEKK